MKIIGIMACAANGVVGNKGTIPWHYPEEFQHFRDIIGTRPVIMGRRTFETIPRSILQDRSNIIVSSQSSSSLAEDPEIKTPPVGWYPFGELFITGSPRSEDDEFGEKAFMIGGAQLANSFLEHNLLAEFILTKLHRSYDGDAVLNLKALENWNAYVIKESEHYNIYRLTPCPI